LSPTYSDIPTLNIFKLFPTSNDGLMAKIKYFHLKLFILTTKQNEQSRQGKSLFLRKKLIPVNYFSGTIED
jgi:hypothetical protein